ncbi:MAG: pilus assembly protein PilM [Solirubrobacterales bacterium]
MQLKLSKRSEDQEAQAPVAKSKQVNIDALNARGKTEELVGLDVSASMLAAARVVDGRIKMASVTSLDQGAMVDGEVNDADAFGAAIAEFFDANGMPRKVRMGVANHRVVIRTIQVPAISDRKELDAAIRFQAADQIPMPLNEAVLDYSVVRQLPQTEAGEQPKLEVLLVAASRGLIDGYVEAARKGGVKLSGIDLSAFSLIRTLYPGASAAAETIAYLHYGDVINVTIATGQHCKFTRSTPDGHSALVERLATRLNLTTDHSTMWLDHVGVIAPLESIQGEPDIVTAARDELVATAEHLSRDVTAAVDFHVGQDPTSRISRVLLAGPGSSIPGMAETIAARTGLAVEIPAPLGALDDSSLTDSGIDRRKLTLAAGLAMEQAVAT